MPERDAEAGGDELPGQFGLAAEAVYNPELGGFEVLPEFEHTSVSAHAVYDKGLA